MRYTKLHKEITTITEYKMAKNTEETVPEVTMEVTQKTVLEYMEEIEEVQKSVMSGQRKLNQLHKDLERAHKREIRTARKSRKSSRATGEKKDPSGFNKPQPVPVEFHCQPWGCTADQELPRTVLTKMVYDYIKENDLQAEHDKRVIKPDAVLRKLFHLKEDDTLEFKNFQTYMARLYKRNFDDDDTWESQASSTSESEADEPKKKAGKKVSGSKKGKKGKTSANASI